MSQSETKRAEQPFELERIPFSNSIQLSGRQWLGLGLFGIVFALFAPSLWERVETLPLEPDYRIPHELSNDYWLYARYASLAAEQYDAVVIGDSVVWGEYVIPEATLSHYLNKEAGRERFANLGLGGAHQLALSGLVELYAASIKNKIVVLQCNPLWMTSLKSDLQDEKVEDINHPRLIPQFLPRVPPHKVEISARLGVLVEQRFGFNQWTNHLQQAYYDRSDIPAWTITHPYDDPLKPLLRGLPPLDRGPRYEQLPWNKTGKKKVDFDWINLDTSLQWRSFQRTAELLQQRGNRLFVLVGPLNEPMLTAASLGRYQKVKATIKDWLQLKQVPHAVPGALASEQYGDASHPLAVGYATLARQLQQDPFFRTKP